MTLAGIWFTQRKEQNGLPPLPTADHLLSSYEKIEILGFEEIIKVLRSLRSVFGDLVFYGEPKKLNRTALRHYAQDCWKERQRQRQNWVTRLKIMDRKKRLPNIFVW